MTEKDTIAKSTSGFIPNYIFYRIARWCYGPIILSQLWLRLMKFIIWKHSTAPPAI